MGTLPIRILVAVEDTSDRAIVEGMLARAGAAHVDASPCERLDDAIAHVRTRSTDAVILALDLRDSKGVKTATAFHAACPHVPVIVLAVEDDDTVAIQVLQAGAQDILFRGGFDERLLLRAIHYALERHEMHAQLNQSLRDARNSEANLRNVISRSADGMVVLDEKGVVVFVNVAAEQLLDRKSESMVDKPFAFPLSAGEAREVEVLGTVFLEMRAVELEWERKRALLVNLRDLTDRRRAEEFKVRLIHADRLAAIGQLAAGVAHEINNPAAFILANQSMMREDLVKLGIVFASLRAYVSDEVDAERRAILDAVLPKSTLDVLVKDMHEMLVDNIEGMERIRSIVKDLRTFSRIEQDDVELVQLGDVVDVACNMVFNEIRHRARLIKEIDRVPFIAADRGKLAQVVMNLLVNAAHAIESGTADKNRITVQTRQVGDSIILSVEDTGMGMTEEVRARIFEPFFTTKPREQGTGLGLSLCADIVRKHGGEIRVTSEVGKGTRFDVVFPLETGLALPMRRASTPTPRAPVSRAKILFVDDEETLLRAYRRMFESSHDVVLAKGGAEGLAAIERGHFDLIICDLMMPQVDGPMIYEAVRARDPSILDRIVFCTGGAFTPRVKEFMNNVDNMFLEKPISRELFMAVIQRMCGRPSSDEPLSSAPPPSPRPS